MQQDWEEWEHLLAPITASESDLLAMGIQFLKGSATGAALDEQQDNRCKWTAS